MFMESGCTRQACHARSAQPTMHIPVQIAEILILVARSALLATVMALTTPTKSLGNYEL